MENLDRGIVAVYESSSTVYVGWRMFGTDPSTIAFNVYRNSVKINASPITDSTNYLDTGGSLSSTYSVAPVIDGVEQELSDPVAVWNNFYHDIPLQVPAGGTTPDGVDYTYSPNDASVGDLDGDGQYEIVLKWDPSNSKDNSLSGYTGDVYLDAYEMDGTFLWRIDLGRNIRAGAHYTQFMVYDLDSDGRAEVVCKTADGTVDGVGTVIGDPSADYRDDGSSNSKLTGKIVSGPEYLTVFDGLTGAALDTVDYIPPRYPDTLFPTASQLNALWGDNYGNRVDRFLACVAYLDGVHPSVVMCRGYYTRAVLAAWDFQNDHLTQRWVFDSYDGTPGNSAYSGQGDHNLSVADVDGDGKDEIVYGSCTIDDDGTGLYSTGLGHGDALHVSDMDPDRPGLEVWQCHEGSQAGATYRDAATGEVIFDDYNSGDVGRACAGHIDSRYPGYQLWSTASSNVFNTDGTVISSKRPSVNFLAWWTGDLQRELLDSAGGSGTNPILDKWNGNGTDRLLSLYSIPTSYSTASNNGTKANPCLSGDILGDWREEIFCRSSDNTKLRIFTTTDLTSHRIYTLMHDPQYRLSIAWQNVGYNQPPHTSFYLGDGMADPPVPDIVLTGTSPLYGDFTGDYKVNIEDLPYFIDFWLEDNCAQTADLDLNDDCIINYYEFSKLAGNWMPDKTPPLAPTGLSATAGNGAVSLDWHNSGENDLNGYNVYRSMVSGSGYTLLNTLLLSSSDYVDTDVVNGTTYYYVVTALDTASNESETSSEVSATPDVITTMTIQENEAGYVDVVNGTIDSNHVGYTGTGFVNTDNAVDQYIEWTVDAPAPGDYDLQWRFANGSSGNRTGAASINGTTQITNIDFPGTGDNNWDAWYLSSTVTVSLSEGTNTIRLISETSDGLANIDWIQVTGALP